MPDLLDEQSAFELAERGIAAAAGLREAIRCAGALRAPRPTAERLEAIATAAERPEGAGGDGAWLSESESKGLLGDAGLAVPPGGEATDADAAVALAEEIDGPVALKISSSGLRHKSEAGALALGLEGEEEVRAACARLLALPEAEGATLLVEAMVDGEAELIVAARRDGVVPALAIGLGGIWAEALDDVAIVPLPASPERVERALRELRGAAALGGERGGPPLDIPAAAAFGSRLGELLLDEGLDLVEVNPALFGRDDCVAVDAVGRRRG
jgi:acyl-CoA synthetase (NDP forming)